MEATEKKRYVSEQEFLSWPESAERIELLDGEVIVTPSATWSHQGVSARLFRLLDRWAAARPESWAVGYAPCDIRFGVDRILQPDLFVMSEQIPLGAPMPLRLTPALCVEIVSPSSREYDRRTKRLVYAAAGVREYWVVAPDERVVEVFAGDGLRERQVFDVVFGSQTLPGLDVDLASLFAE